MGSLPPGFTSPNSASAMRGAALLAQVEALEDRRDAVAATRGIADRPAVDQHHHDRLAGGLHRLHQLVLLRRQRQLRDVAQVVVGPGLARRGLVGARPPPPPRPPGGRPRPPRRSRWRFFTGSPKTTLSSVQFGLVLGDARALGVRGRATPAPALSLMPCSRSTPRPGSLRVAAQVRRPSRSGPMTAIVLSSRAVERQAAPVVLQEHDRAARGLERERLVLGRVARPRLGALGIHVGVLEQPGQELRAQDARDRAVERRPRGTRPRLHQRPPACAYACGSGSSMSTPASSAWRAASLEVRRPRRAASVICSIA